MTKNNKNEPTSMLGNKKKKKKKKNYKI